VHGTGRERTCVRVCEREIVCVCVCMSARMCARVTARACCVCVYTRATFSLSCSISPAHVRPHPPALFLIRVSDVSRAALPLFTHSRFLTSSPSRPLVHAYCIVFPPHSLACLRALSPKSTRASALYLSVSRSHILFLALTRARALSLSVSLVFSLSLFLGFSVAFSLPCDGVAKTHRMPYLDFIFRKRALYLVALLRKETCYLRHPMYLRHPGALVHCRCFILFLFRFLFCLVLNLSRTLTHRYPLALSLSLGGALSY